MKKILMLGFLLIGFFAQSQSKTNYQRHGKLTQTEINAIDVTDTTLIYTAFNTTTGREEINTGAGWVARWGSGGGTTYTAGNGISINISDEISLDFTAIDTQYPALANLSGTNTGDQDLSGYFLADGSTAATGNFDMDGNQILDIGRLNFESDLTEQFDIQFIGETLLLNPIGGSAIGYNFTGDYWSFPAATRYGIGSGGDAIEMVTVNDNGELSSQSIPSGGGSSTLGGLSDVGIIAPSNGEVLTYDGANWGNEFLDASVVTFSPAGNTTSNFVQAAIEELQTEIDGLNSPSPTTKAFQDKTADFLYSASDVINGSDKIVVRVKDGNSYEGEMEDTDLADKQSILVQAQGSGSEIVTYAKENESLQFVDLSGNTGNQWTVTAPARAVGIKEVGTNLISVDNGVISTRSFITNLYPNDDAAGPNDLPNVTNWSNAFGGTIVAVETTTVPVGQTNAISIETNTTGDGGAYAAIAIGPLEIGVEHTLTIQVHEGNVDAAAIYLQNNGGGFITNQAIPGASWNTLTFVFTPTQPNVDLVPYVTGTETIGQKFYLDLIDLTK